MLYNHIMKPKHIWEAVPSAIILACIAFNVCKKSLTDFNMR